MNPIRPDTVHTYTQIPSSSETQPASHSSSPPSSDLDLAPKIRIPTTPSTIRIPYMSHGLAAHFLAGRAAEGLSIGTERLEGFPQVDLLAYYTQIFANQAKIGAADNEPTVQRLIQEYQGALAFE